MEIVTQLESPWLNAREAAAYIKVSVDTLAYWRHSKQGPKFVTLNLGGIRYHINELDEFVRTGGIRRKPTTGKNIHRKKLSGD